MPSDEQVEFALALLRFAEEALEPEEYKRLFSLLVEKEFRQHVRQLIPNIRDARMIAAVCAEICRRTGIQPSEFKAMPRHEKIQVIEYVMQMGPLEVSRTPTTDPPAGDDDNVAHADDFRSVRWFGSTYEFTTLQAACVKILWEHWERGTPTIGEVALLETAGSAGERLRDIFAKGKHPAWNTMIVPAQKGAVKLASPKRSGTP